MTKIAIVTDSTASIPKSIADKLNIYQVAYYIHRGTEMLQDLVTIQRKEFLKWLSSTDKLPTTASPGPGDYLSMYEKLAHEGFEEIISVHMTSKGSGAYQATKIAQSMIHETMKNLKIKVIDTLNVSMCQGWMVIEAARAAKSGSSLEEIVAKIESMIPITQMIQTADTLRYLYMGGRIGKATHLIGSLLSLKPLISMDNGEIVSLGVARGLNKAYQKMVAHVEATIGPGVRIKVAYVHAGALEKVQILKEIVESKLDCIESFITELSPALMVHTGPGTTGLCYFPVID